MQKGNISRDHMCSNGGYGGTGERTPEIDGRIATVNTDFTL